MKYCYAIGRQYIGYGLQCRPAVECRPALYIDVKTFRLTLASQT